MMLNNINQIMSLYQQLRSNPAQVLAQRFNIPQNLNNPNDIIQHLLNSGQVTQAQVNQAMQMRDNPMFKELFK